MALICEVKLNELGKGSGNYSVVATITDDTKPVETRTVVVNEISSARIDTEKQKTDLWENIWIHYQAKLTTSTSLVPVENEAKEYLEAKKIL